MSWEGNVWRGKAVKISFKVPSKFDALLAAGVRDSWELLQEVNGAPLREKAKIWLLREAASKGLEEARAKLHALLREAPDGRLRFYKDKRPSLRVDLTDGKVCLEFNVAENLKRLVGKLPLNVHLECEETGFTLDLKKFRQASAELGEFFSFVLRTREIRRYFSLKTCRRIFEAYFADKGEAYGLLAKAEGRAKHIMEREELFQQLRENGAMRCPGGFLACCPDWESVYYVTEDGAVRCFAQESSEGFLEAIFRLVREGVVPRKLEEVCDADELLEVAKVVGKVCPHLVPIIAP